MSKSNTINHSPLIIAGMHRSGTSLTASILRQSGIDIGRNLFSADQHNQRGYFEDVDFLEFQRYLLQQSCGDRQPGWPDWGWTAAEKLDRDPWNAAIPDAQALIEQRQTKAHWGWKDPRTTLMLDFWQALLPNAKFILVYRFPWDVADSIFRIGHPYFLDNADMGIRAWFFYNWHLIDFYRKNTDKALLFNINALSQQPRFIIDTLRHKLNYDRLRVERTMPQAIIEPRLMGQLPFDSSLVEGLKVIAPRYLDLLALLDHYADLPSIFKAEAPLNFGLQETLNTSDDHPERHLLALYGQKLQQERQSAQDAHHLGERLAYLEAALKTYEQSKVTRGYMRLRRRVFERFQR